MNKEIKEKWIEGLCSGKYKQGKGYLRQGEEYCCLGVLAQIVDDTKWVHTDVGKGICKYGDDVTFLPHNYQGLPLSVQQELSVMNDSGEAFEDIAKYIEENL